MGGRINDDDDDDGDDMEKMIVDDDLVSISTVERIILIKLFQ